MRKNSLLYNWKGEKTDRKTNRKTGRRKIGRINENRWEDR